LGLGVAVLLAIRRSVRERICRPLADADRFWLLPFGLLAYCLAFHLLGGETAPARVGLLALYFLLPALLLHLRGRYEGGATWLDFTVILLLWMPIELRWVQKAVAIEGVKYPVSALSAVLYALLLFTAWRRVDLHCDWTLSRDDLKRVGLAFLVLCAAILPPAFAVDFVHFGLNAKLEGRLWAAPLVLAGLFILPAFAEELMFRGLLQNLLATRLKWLWALGIASAVFGLAHVNNTVSNSVAHFGRPNWTYVAFATIAGLGYGWVYHRTRSLVASSLLHAGVDFTWLLFLKS
jgi:membrane protease YdiL (CAAX protease family)